MKKVIFLLAAAVSILLAGGELELHPTFVSCGYYWTSGGSMDGVKVEYREKSSSDWRRGLSPDWYEDGRMYRGSLAGLRENTRYEIRLTDRSGNVLASGTFHTWAEEIPIARTIPLSSRIKNGGIEIRDRGTPDGWIRFTAAPGEPLRLPRGILIHNAAYITIDGAVIQGGVPHAVRIEHSTAIRISNCDISGWGRAGKRDPFTRLFVDSKGRLICSDAGISLESSRNCVVERTYFHDPAAPSSGWAYGHPVGPVAMWVNKLEGTVIRWNDFVGSDDEFRWNDAIEGGGGNVAPDAGFRRDADIYGNYFAFPHDDGIELDGGQMNVRVFENKFEGGFCGVSTIACSRGPSYIWNNLLVNAGDADGAANIAVKDMFRPAFIGRIYYFNNTIVGLGSGFPSTPNRMRRNQVVAVTEAAGSASSPTEQKADVRRELLWSASGRQTGQPGPETQTIPPRFVDAARGLYALKSDFPQARNGCAVPGFSSPWLGALPPGSREPGPVRPVPFTVDAGQIRFESPDKPMKIRVDAGRFKGELSIAKNTSFRWFEVTPDRFHLNPGESAVLTVTIRLAAASRGGLLNGAFLVRDGSGRSRPVTVYAVNPLKSETIHLPETAIDVPIENGIAEFTIPAEGDYHLLIHCLADRFYNTGKVELDGKKLNISRMGVNGGRWRWCGIRSPEIREIYAKWVHALHVPHRLKAGTHRLKTLMPPHQVKADRLVITPDFSLPAGNVNRFDLPFLP